MAQRQPINNQGDAPGRFDQPVKAGPTPAGGVTVCTVTIDNSGGGALTDYQVRVEVEYVAGMRNDFNDIRFYDSDGVTALDHWREYHFDESVAVFWVKVPIIGAGATKTIYLHYGVEAASASDDVATMITGADFDDGATTGLTINTAGAGAATVPALVAAEWVYGYRVDGWTKYGDNPIIALGAGGTWDDASIRDLGIVISDEDNKPIREAVTGNMITYYGGNDGAEWAIGIAKSSDEGFTWGSRARVIAPSGGVGSWYRNDIFQPSVIQRQSDSVYLMMAHGKDTVAGTERLGVFTSNDGVAWSDGGWKIRASDVTWDGVTGIDLIGVPSVIKRSAGDYLCVFEGHKFGGANDWAIFGATSNDFTGAWSVLNGGHPIFSPTGAGWEQDGVANCHIIEAADGQYLMAYNGIGAAGQWQIGFASTTDLSVWIRYASNPVISPSSAAWEQQHNEIAGFVRGEGTWNRLYYQGFNAGVAQIGMALSNQTRFLHGISAANADGWIVGKDMDGIDNFCFEILVQDTDDSSPGSGSTIYLGLVDSAAVPNPNTVAVINALRRFTVRREEPAGAQPSKFSIQYRTGGGTFLNWDGAAWGAGATYFADAGPYKVKIWDDGTNYKADIQHWASGTSILPNVASIAKATVAAFANGRVMLFGEIFTDAYYMGQENDNLFIREYEDPEPSASVS